MESFKKDLFEQFVGHPVNFIQDNESKSSKGVLRGLHFQKGHLSQSKLVRVIEGEVIDVVVDLRKGAPTFGKSVVVKLSSDNKKQLFVPKGFAHGFIVLSESAIFSYKVDAPYSFEDEGNNIHCTVSIGVAVCSKGNNCFGDLLKEADRALYLAKEQGRNQVCYREACNKKEDN